MENKKLTNPIPEELNEENLRVVSGGTGNVTAIPYLPLNNPNVGTCTKCGKLKYIVYYYNEKKYCEACWTRA